MEENIHEIFVAPIDYEEQSFLDNKKNNPYVIAVAAARYSRELNDRVRKYFGPETNVQPRNIAMKNLESEKTGIIIEEEKKETKPDTSQVEK
jgi:DNA-directed RNA polymerase subunit K/omega